MRYCVSPSVLEGTIEVPSSKSHTQRAILFALLGEGTSKIYKPLLSSDTANMLKAVELLGALVKKDKEHLAITGVGSNLKTAQDVIYAGNSGIILRFIGALSALTSGYTIITGDDSLRMHRPIKPLLAALSELKVFAKSARQDGLAPLIVRGPLKGGICTLDGEDSQPVSALLIATSFAPYPTEIYVNSPGEKPWIDLTLHWLDFLKIPYKNNDYSHYIIPGRASYQAFHITIPGDLSSLAMPVAAALITQSEITIENVNLNDVQGDKKLFEVLRAMGANFQVKADTLTVKKGQTLKGCTLDINDYIDSITILAVIACFAEGETILTNASVARYKECNRIHAITTELKKMGGDIEEREDGLVIRPAKLKGAILESYQDHRMAMSLTVAALGAEGKSIIKGVECVSKTYPHFKEQMQKLGAQIE